MIITGATYLSLLELNCHPLTLMLSWYSSVYVLECRVHCVVLLIYMFMHTFIQRFRRLQKMMDKLTGKSNYRRYLLYGVQVTYKDFKLEKDNISIVLHQISAWVSAPELLTLPSLPFTFNILVNTYWSTAPGAWTNAYFKVYLNFSWRFACIKQPRAYIRLNNATLDKYSDDHWLNLPEAMLFLKTCVSGSDTFHHIESLKCTWFISLCNPESRYI